MRKISSIGLVLLLAVSVSGCEVIRPAATRAENRTNTAVPANTKQAATVASGDSTGATNTIIEPATTTPVTTTSVTQPAETKPVETKPVETTTPVTTTAQTQAQEAAKSNLPPELRAQLDKSENGIMLVYFPEKFPEIKAITRWTIITYDTHTQAFLVTKKKGSIVEVSNAELTNDDRIVIPGEVIRDWETTSDYEVIRIVYTDPETIPFNFIKVKEPGGKVTTTHLRTSMRDNPDWEVYPYDK